MESSFSSQGDRPMSRALATASLGVPTSMGIVNMGQTMRKQLEAQAVLLARVTASAHNTVSFHFPSFGQTFPFSHSVGVFFPLKNQGERTESPFSEGEAPHRITTPASHQTPSGRGWSRSSCGQTSVPALGQLTSWEARAWAPLRPLALFQANL